MYQGMSLNCSQSLELRQEMEQTLEQGLFVVQELKLTQELYIKRESKLTRFYRDALKRGMVKLYDKHGMRFEYALVSKRDISADLSVYGMAFSHCLFNGFEALLFGEQHAMARGSWLLFVVYDMYPGAIDEYVEYAAVHERGEQVTLGDHNLASKLEFALARKENNLASYMAWIEECCPGKFADVFAYQIHLKLPATDEFQKVLESFASSEEATKVRQMIEGFEWPHRILQRLTLYKKKNDEVIEIINEAMRIAEFLADDVATFTLSNLVQGIRKEVSKQLRLIEERKLVQYISFPHLNMLWRELLIGVDRKFVETLHERKRYPNYLQELLDANINDGLPRDGVLSHSLREALSAL